MTRADLEEFLQTLREEIKPIREKLLAVLENSPRFDIDDSGKFFHNDGEFILAEDVDRAIAIIREELK